MPNRVTRIFSRDDLEEIVAVARAAEQQTSGEIRVSIRQRRARKERTVNIEHLAWREFQHLGMNRTKQRNGVLLFLLLEDRELYICADAGIHSKVDSGLWQMLADDLSMNFQKGRFREGLIQAVKAIGNVLAEHFPHRPDDVN